MGKPDGTGVIVTHCYYSLQLEMQLEMKELESLAQRGGDC
jgi:hypothetical protein